MVCKEKLRKRDSTKNRETDYEPIKQFRQEMIMAWSRDAAVVVMRSDCIMSIF